MRDVLKGVGAFLALLLLLIIAREALAERPVNGWLPTGAAVYIGIDDDLAVGADHGVVSCHDDGHHTGVFGARIPAYRWGDRHTLVLALSHQSCLEEERDLSSDDRLGVRYEYQLW